MSSKVNNLLSFTFTRFYIYCSLVTFHHAARRSCAAPWTAPRSVKNEVEVVTRADFLSDVRRRYGLLGRTDAQTLRAVQLAYSASGEEWLGNSHLLGATFPKAMAALQGVGAPWAEVRALVALVGLGAGLGLGLSVGCWT